jgi:hypothetical protein
MVPIAPLFRTSRSARGIVAAGGPALAGALAPAAGAADAPAGACAEVLARPTSSWCTANGRRWFYVWYDKVYARRDGRWVYLSHRTVDGAHYRADRASVSTTAPAVARCE